MENYQMRRGCGRPYNTTCGMGNQREMSCTRRTLTEKPAVSGKEMYTHVDHMEPAMACLLLYRKKAGTQNIYTPA